MKKSLKLILIMMIALGIIMTSCTLFVSSAGSSASGVDPSTFKGSSAANTQGITNIGNQLITIISTIGSIASVIVLVVLGIKYMMGSAEEKAEYKKTLLPYVIGAGLVFAASAIAGVVFTFTQGLSA